MSKAQVKAAATKPAPEKTPAKPEKVPAKPAKAPAVPAKTPAKTPTKTESKSKTFVVYVRGEKDANWSCHGTKDNLTESQAKAVAKEYEEQELETRVLPDDAMPPSIAE